MKADDVYAILNKRIKNGGATDEQIQNAVNQFLIENPVQVGIKVSDTEPTEESVEVWINPNEEEEYQFPEIRDDEESEVDTWSSKKIGEKYGELKSDIDSLDKKNFDLYSELTFDESFLNVNSNGVLSPNVNHKCSGYIPVKNGDVIYYNLRGSNSNVYVLGFYQGTKNYPSEFISGIKAIDQAHDVVGSVEITTDCYMRLCNRKDYLNGYAYFKVNIPDKEKLLFNETNTKVDKNSLAIKKNATEIEKINNNLSKVTIPTYFEEEVSSAEKTILTKLQSAGKNKSTFIFLTDVHWEMNQKNSPAIVKHIVDNTPIQKVFFGGDVITNVSNDRNAMLQLGHDFQKQFKFLGTDFYCMYGNHDANSNNQNVQDAILTESEVYMYLQSQIENGNNLVYGDYYYYYLDNVIEKTRYIVLDTGRYVISDSEVQFIIDALTDVGDGWHVVFLTHVLYVPTTYNKPLEGGKIPWYIENLLKMLDNYNARKSGDMYGDTKNTHYDFSQSRGTIECCIGGHLHADFSYRSDGGIMCMMFDCDAMSTYGNYTSTEGTATEQCITTVVIDYEANSINCIRVGRGENMIFDIKQVN